MFKRPLSLLALAIGTIVALVLLTSAPVIPPKPLSAGNWAGYAASGKIDTFNGVSATWKVPTLNCSATPDGYASQWVGLDGLNDTTVEQLGIQDQCVGGQPGYFAWFEMYPYYPVSSTVAVKPGDEVSATLHAVDGSYQLTLTNLTTGQSQTRISNCAQCEDSSAEVISEAPSDAVGTVPLADFGSTTFQNVTVMTAGPFGPEHHPLISSMWRSFEITQRQNGEKLDIPSSLINGAFTAHWEGAGE